MRWLVIAALMGCAGDKPAETDVVVVDEGVDADGDGFEADDDCDDNDPARNPNAPELCNGIDDNCDTRIDNDPTDATAWYADGDADGYGGSLTLSYACEAPAGYVAEATDCNDQDAAIHPGAPEACNGIDDDCDSLVDDDDEVRVGLLDFHPDADTDGAGDLSILVQACVAPAGHVAAGGEGDCDDADASTFPGAAEVPLTGLDRNCDGLLSCWGDDDGDGFGGAIVPHPASDPDCLDPDLSLAGAIAARGGDCDDADGAISPEAVEICEPPGVDEDCDGLVDDDDEVVGTDWYEDADVDGFGAGDAVNACLAPLNHVDRNGDCDDSDDGRAPDVVEVCNGVDQDCDGVADNDAINGDDWWIDGDGDGFGDAASLLSACLPPVDGVDNGDDCDDANVDVYPFAPEVVCDGLVNACGGTAGVGGAMVEGQPYADLTTAARTAPDGAHITLCEGTHTATNLEVPDGVLLDSLMPLEEAIVTGPTRGAIFKVVGGDSATFMGLTLTGGQGFNNPSTPEGGAIWVGGIGEVTLTDMVLHDNHGGRGGALFLGRGATATLTDVLFENNHADASTATFGPSGGALYVSDEAAVTATRVTMRSNTGELCGALSMLEGASVVGDDLLIENNRAILAEGGGACVRRESSLSGAVVRLNQARSNGGGVWGETMTLTDVRIEDNTSDSYGGGVRVGGVNNVLADVTIDGNIAQDGGGLYLRDNARLRTEGGAVTRNETDSLLFFGGGARVASGEIESINTNWGDPGAGDDNVPVDIWYVQEGLPQGWFGVSSFNCSGAISCVL